MTPGASSPGARTYERERERRGREKTRKRSREGGSEKKGRLAPFHSSPLLIPLTSGCVSCVGCPASSSKEGREANEREEKGCFVRREEQEVEVVDVSERAIATIIDDGESLAAEAAVAAQRLARNRGRDILPARTIVDKSERASNSPFFLRRCFCLLALRRPSSREWEARSKKKKSGLKTLHFLLSSPLSVSTSSAPRRPPQETIVMQSVAVAATTGGAAVSVFAGQQQQNHARRIPVTNDVAGRLRRRRFSLASAQPLSAQTYTSDILKAAAVQAPSGAVVPGLASEEQHEVVALKSVSKAAANATAADAADANAEQPPHAPLRSPTSPLINWLPRTRWPKGIPVVMGAHLLASHGVAPISVSKGLSTLFFFFLLRILRSSLPRRRPPQH